MSVLIAIEGIDGSGKGTQAARLHTHFLSQGLKSTMLSFPRYQQTRFGQKVGDFLNGEFGTLDTVHPLLVSLLFAGDRFESRELIEQMRKAVTAVQTLPEMDAFFSAQGATAMKAGPAELATITKDELARWAPVIRESGMKVD